MLPKLKWIQAAAVLCVLTPLWAQPQVLWEKDLESALAASKKQGKPLLISMHTSTEIACQRMLTSLYRDPAIVPILNEFVLLPTCFDVHQEETRTVGGKKLSVSPLFGTVNCAQLTKNEADVRAAFFDKSVVKVPQHIFVDGSGKTYMKKVYELKKPAFISLLNNALVLYGSKAARGMDKVSKGLFNAVRKGKKKDKRLAVRSILDQEDPRKTDILYFTIQSITREQDKGECVRAFGKDIYGWASPTVAKWLRDPSDHVKNCAVVSLEEMKATGVVDQLLTMYENARDKELKKDLLRALGPCGEDSDEAKAVLVKAVKDRREDNRIASYLSLGYYLDQEDVQQLLSKRFKKEGRSVAAKTAIIWAHTYLGDESLIPHMRDMIAGEKNRQLEYMVNAAELQIRTGTGVARKDGKGGYVKLHKAFGAIFGKDKILRNAYKYWKGDD